MEVLETVRQLWDAANTIHEMAERQWAQNKQLVNSQHITARKPGQSSLFIPKIETFHFRKQADFLQAFGSVDPVSLKATLTSTKEGAKIMESVVNYYVSDAGGIDWPSSTLNAAHNALTCNFAPWHLDWDRGVEKEKVDVQVIKDGEVVIEEDEKEVETYSFPTLEIFPPEDVRIDPSIGWNEIGLARFCIFRKWVDKAFAEKMASQGIWPEISDDEFTAEPKNTLLQNQRAQFGTFPATDINDNLIEIWITYLQYEDGEEYYPARMVTLADRKVLEEPEELELPIANSDGTDPWPFGVAKIYVEPHEIHSRAMPERLKDLQVEENAIRNQRRDNVALILNREKFMTPSAGVDPAVLSRSFAGKVTTVASRDSVWWDSPPDVTASSYNEENITSRDMETLVAESPQRLGATGQRKETATVAKITQGNASQFLSLDLSVFSMTYAIPVMKKLIKMIRVAAPPIIFERAAEDLGIDVEDAYLEALRGDYRISVGSGAHQAARDLAISNASNIAAIVQSVYGPNANYNPIMKPMLEENGLNPDDIIPQQRGGQVDPNSPAFTDLGGVEGTDRLQVQPNVQLTGGAFKAQNA